MVSATPTAFFELEQPVLCAAAFDDPRWLFSPGWEGMRVTVRVAEGRPGLLRDERGRDVTWLFPEAAADLAVLAPPAGLLAEGVIAIGDAQGRPDLPELWRRIAAARLGRAGMVPGAILLITDLLGIGAESLAGRGFERRLARLRESVAVAGRVLIPDWITGAGQALAGGAAGRGLAAIVGRPADAPYRAGLASPERLWIPLEPRAEAVVAGLLGPPRGRLEAAILAEWSEGRLVAAGRAGLDLAPEVESWVRREARRLAVPRPPLEGDDAEGARWLAPGLVASVRHHGRDGSGRLRLPVVIALRDDRNPAWVRRREPVPPPGGEPRCRQFRPVLIPSLPFD